MRLTLWVNTEKSSSNLKVFRCIINFEATIPSLTYNIHPPNVICLQQNSPYLAHNTRLSPESAGASQIAFQAAIVKS